MLYSIATKMPVIIEKFRDRLAREVGTGGISNPNHLDFVLDYLTKNEKKGGVDMDKFVKECGIGMKLSEEEIKKIIEETIVDATQESNLFDYLGKVKNKIPSVEGKTTKALF